MAPAPQTGEGLSRPCTAEQSGMESSRYRRAERDWIAPTPQSGEGWDRTDTAEWIGMAPAPERDGLALVPPNGEGWKRRDTVERRGMVSPQHLRAERDGLTPASQSRE